jgi:hypothetical protein
MNAGVFMIQISAWNPNTNLKLDGCEDGYANASFWGPPRTTRQMLMYVMAICGVDLKCKSCYGYGTFKESENVEFLYIVPRFWEGEEIVNPSIFEGEPVTSICQVVVKQ